MPKPQPRRHILLQPRALAAIGLISVGGGIGLALMLARTIIWVGFAVALGSALLVFWLYWDALRSVYRAASKRIPYRGPALLEVAVATGIAVLMIGISIAVFPIVMAQQSPVGKASLEFGGTVDFVKAPPSSPTGLLNVTIKNAGNLNAEHLTLILIGRVRSGLIAQSDLDRDMKLLEDEVHRADQVAGWQGMQLRPGVSSVISLQDIDASKLSEMRANNSVPGAVQLTDDQWRDFENGKSSIYVLYVAHYQDEGHPGAYWTAATCLYFIATRAYWHACGPNRTDLVNLPR